MHLKLFKTLKERVNENLFNTHLNADLNTIVLKELYEDEFC